MGDEFVELLERDMELLYEQYVMFDGGCASGSKSTMSHTRNEGSISTKSSYIIDPLTFLRNFHKEWKSATLMTGHQLYGHVDGSRPMPPSSIDNAPNPEHAKWVLQDKLIMSTLNASLSDSVLGQVLDCLGTEYESLVTSLTTCVDTISSRQLYSYLLNHESRISYQTHNLLANTFLAAHNTTSYSPSPQLSRAPSHGGRCGRGRGSFTPRPFSPQFNTASPRPDTCPQCQVCQKFGHTALTCYHRLTTPYPAPSSSPLTANNTYLSTPSPNTTTWYLDTTASHHFTSEFNNLNLKSTPYQGPDQVFIEDGSSLPIHHLGSAQISTTSGNFFLHNLLHVPSISRNLLSIRQFCSDNKVFFEFHSDLFLVKDSCSREVLLQGHVEDGLYAFQSSAVTSSPPHAFLGVRTSAQLWQSRLGHPSPHTTFILRHFNLPFTSSTSINNCLACCNAKAHVLPHPPTSSRSTRPFELLFLDVWGPAPEPSMNGMRYYLSLVDDYSKYVCTSHINSQSSLSSVAASSSLPYIASQLEFVDLPSSSHGQLPLSSTHPMVTRSKTHTMCPRRRNDGTIPWPSSQPSGSFTTSMIPRKSSSLSVPKESTSFSEASKHAEWRTATATEFDALLHNQTWDLVPTSLTYNLLGSKWVLKSKCRADGSLERGKNAFLHGDLEEAVYMKQPPGFVNPDFSAHVCKLKTGFLSDKLLNLGFTCSTSYSSLFIMPTASDCLYLLIYVDDILVTGSSSTLIADFISSLKQYFPIKDLGFLNYFLGIEVSRTQSSLCLSQSKYIDDLLIRTHMHDSKPVNTPMSITKLTALDGPTFDDPHWYRSVVGNLQYLAFTRPDISFAVNHVCQYMHSPRLPHWKAVKRILRYLNQIADIVTKPLSAPRFAQHRSSLTIVPVMLGSWRDIKAVELLKDLLQQPSRSKKKIQKDLDCNQLNDVSQS
ncbi:hypothetical protein F2P56_034969 [Juglans regia]|uniref:Reverse transcriptase Ty1/copia-type domain-containing protein n=1 Tax=Juglans regia TaxID=51240 RepID=A0A833WRV5_JUGRE|nr:hypothetical protein F2P56_034969 [Juglans regia]